MYHHFLDCPTLNAMLWELVGLPDISSINGRDSNDPHLLRSKHHRKFSLKSTFSLARRGDRLILLGFSRLLLYLWPSGSISDNLLWLVLRSLLISSLSLMALQGRSVRVPDAVYKENYPSCCYLYKCSRRHYFSPNITSSWINRTGQLCI